MLFQTRETESGRMLSAKELHKYLEIGRVFNSWIRGRIDKYQFEKGIDYREIWVHNETGEMLELNSDDSKMVSAGYQKDYFISTDMVKELCVIENSEHARKARKYLLANENCYINSLKARVQLLDTNKIDGDKLEEWQKLIEMMKEIHPTLFKFKNQMLNMIWQANKLSDEVNQMSSVELGIDVEV